MKRHMLLLLGAAFLITSCGKSSTPSSEQEVDKIWAEWQEKRTSLLNELAPLYDSLNKEGAFEKDFLDKNDDDSLTNKEEVFRDPMGFFRRMAVKELKKEIKKGEKRVLALKEEEKEPTFYRWDKKDQENHKKKLKMEEKLLEMNKLRAEYYEKVMEAAKKKKIVNY